jgi:hypothetical protein
MVCNFINEQQSFLFIEDKTEYSYTKVQPTLFVYGNEEILYIIGKDVLELNIDYIHKNIDATK